MASIRTQYSEKDLKCLEYFIQVAKTAEEPVPRLAVFKQWPERDKYNVSVTHFYYRIPKMVRLLTESDRFTPELKARFMFMTSTPVKPKLLAQIQAGAVVNLNTGRQITSYESSDGTVRFEGKHKTQYTTNGKRRKSNAKKPGRKPKSTIQLEPVMDTEDEDDIIVEEETGEEMIVEEEYRFVADDMDQRNEERIQQVQQHRPETPPRTPTPQEIKPTRINVPTNFNNGNAEEARAPIQMAQHREFRGFWDPQLGAAGQPQPMVMAYGPPHNLTRQFQYQGAPMTAHQNFGGPFQEKMALSDQALRREDSASTACTTVNDPLQNINFYAQVLKMVHHFLFGIMETSLPNLAKLTKEVKASGTGMSMTPDSIKAYLIVAINKVFKSKRRMSTKTEPDEILKMKEVLEELSEQVNTLEDPLKSDLNSFITARLQMTMEIDTVSKMVVRQVFEELVKELEENSRAGI